MVMGIGFFLLGPDKTFTGIDKNLIVSFIG
jgi:hypothetical protein